MFRLANLRHNVLMEMEARVLMVLTEKRGDESIRRFHVLKLETHKIHFLPLTWTVVHPINEDSPLHGVTPETLAARVLRAEHALYWRVIREQFCSGAPREGSTSLRT